MTGSDVANGSNTAASTTSARRQAASFLVERNISTRRACWWLGLGRSWLKYASSRSMRDEELVERLQELACVHSSYGVRFLHAKLRQEGLIVNVKRIHRLCRRHGLLLKQKVRRKRRGIGVGMPCKSEHPNQVWAYDFMEERTDGGRNGGRKLRILTVIDEFTRRCIGVEVEYRMNAKFVAQTLLRLFATHGTPRFIRSDNGPEFIARFLMRVLQIHGVEARHIDPGSPWQNGIDERFNGTLRRECTNRETFHNRDHARALIKLYARSYTNDRPHSSLRYLTPAEFTAKWRREHTEECKPAAEEPEDGCAGGGVMRLSLCASSGRGGEEEGSGPIDAGERSPPSDRLDDRQTVQVGARVARQQKRRPSLRGSISRLNEASVAKEREAGKFPARHPVEVAGRL